MYLEHKGAGRWINGRVVPQIWNSDCGHPSCHGEYSADSACTSRKHFPKGPDGVEQPYDLEDLHGCRGETSERNSDTHPRMTKIVIQPALELVLYKGVSNVPESLEVQVYSRSGTFGPVDEVELHLDFGLDPTNSIGSTCVSALQGEVQSLREEISLINATQAALDRTATQDIPALQNHIGLIQTVWDDLVAESTNLIGWLQNGANDAAIPAALQVWLSKGKTLYSTWRDAFTQYAELVVVPA
ncbi:hypothetical protein R3P38DRAFT_2813057 [Favolaschia claudopus]|uniref:Uncharacterized protein n=1 Tax=Favolaschia claudopus TaxID=2862362 RepID=A0AAV9Z6D6_9AGAR